MLLYILVLNVTFSGSCTDSALPWMTSITSLKPFFSTSVRACRAISVYSTAYTYMTTHSTPAESRRGWISHDMT